ncbi:MAG: hypothetical protein AAGB51_13500 [Planctomycetota bacterium]
MSTEDLSMLEYYDQFRLPRDFFEARLVMLQPMYLSRALGWDPGPDYSMELTPAHIVEAAEVYIDEGKHIGNAMRQMDVGGFRLICIAGIPDEVSAAIMYGLRLPERCKGKMCLFVLHARPTYE